jgi:uncharacterized protein YndB with AHSA1/START domain
MGKIIHQSTKLTCTRQKAFQMFTVNRHLEKWLTQRAEVELRVGGKFELFWNPKDKENDSTIGCKILALQPNKFLSFEWKGPKQFSHFMNHTRPLTNVVAFFIPYRGGTEVHLLHVGWRDTAEWQKAREWFDKAWATSFAQLQKYVGE